MRWHVGRECQGEPSNQRGSHSPSLKPENLAPGSKKGEREPSGWVGGSREEGGGGG